MGLGDWAVPRGVTDKFTLIDDAQYDTWFERGPAEVTPGPASITPVTSRPANTQNAVYLDDGRVLKAILTPCAYNCSGCVLFEDPHFAEDCNDTEPNGDYRYPCNTDNRIDRTECIWVLASERWK